MEFSSELIKEFGGSIGDVIKKELDTSKNDFEKLSSISLEPSREKQMYLIGLTGVYNDYPGVIKLHQESLLKVYDFEVDILFQKEFLLTDSIKTVSIQRWRRKQAIRIQHMDYDIPSNSFFFCDALKQDEGAVRYSVSINARGMQSAWMEYCRLYAYPMG